MTEKQAIDLGYKQLWLFAWRHFPELSAIAPRKDSGRPKPSSKGSDERSLHRFARLARSLGFETDSIQHILSNNPDFNMSRDFLRRVRPPDSYDVSDLACQPVIDGVLQYLSMIREHRQPPMKTMESAEVPRASRCGRPHEKSHRKAKEVFFPDHFETPTLGIVTHLSVHRDIFDTFFGDAMAIAKGTQRSSGPNNPPDPSGSSSIAADGNPPDLGASSSIGASRNLSLSQEDGTQQVQVDSLQNRDAPATPGTQSIEGRSETSAPQAQSENTALVPYTTLLDKRSEVTGQMPYEFFALNDRFTPKLSTRYGLIRDGGLFLIIIPEWQSIVYKSEGDARDGEHHMLNTVNTHLLSVYHARKNEMICIEPTRLGRYAKGVIGQDGVIFAFNRDQLHFSFQDIVGATTTNRLDNLQSWVPRIHINKRKDAREDAAPEFANEPPIDRPINLGKRKKAKMRPPKNVMESENSTGTETQQQGTVQASQQSGGFGISQSIPEEEDEVGMIE